MQLKDLLKKLKALGTDQNIKIYTRHGMTGEIYGVSFANLTKLKKQIKTDHELANCTWSPLLRNMP